MEAQEARRASTMVSEEQKRHEKDSRFRDKKWEEDQKVLEKRKANQDRLAALHVEGFLEEPIERSKPGEVRCGACGLWGHNKSAKECPFFGIEQEQDKADAEGFKSGMARQDLTSGGTKVTIDVRKVNELKNQNLLMINITDKFKKTDKYKREREEKAHIAHVAHGNVKQRASRMERRHGRKSGSARVYLNDLVREIVGGFLKNTKYQAFWYPAEHTAGADYRRVIAEPMDLSTIDKKAKEQQYDSTAAFRHDAELMLANCRQYQAAINNANAWLLDVADALSDQLARELGVRSERLDDLDAQLIQERDAPRTPLQPAARRRGRRAAPRRGAAGVSGGGTGGAGGTGGGKAKAAAGRSGRARAAAASSTWRAASARRRCRRRPARAARRRAARRLGTPHKAARGGWSDSPSAGGTTPGASSSVMPASTHELGIALLAAAWSRRATSTAATAAAAAAAAAPAPSRRRTRRSSTSRARRASGTLAAASPATPTRRWATAATTTTTTRTWRWP